MPVIPAAISPSYYTCTPEAAAAAPAARTASQRQALAERSRLYGRLDSQSGLSALYAISPSARSNVRVAGVETDYVVAGQLFSEYRVRDAINAQDVQLASGVRDVWDDAEGLRQSTGVERLVVLSGGGQQATALTGGADWSAHPLWRASGRLEWRRVSATGALAGSDSYLSTLMVARKLDRDWTALARNYMPCLPGTARWPTT